MVPCEQWLTGATARVYLIGYFVYCAEPSRYGAESAKTTNTISALMSLSLSVYYNFTDLVWGEKMTGL